MYLDSLVVIFFGCNIFFVFAFVLLLLLLLFFFIFCCILFVCFSLGRGRGISTINFPFLSKGHYKKKQVNHMTAGSLSGPLASPCDNHQLPH